MSWTSRSSAPTYGTDPYDWGAYTRYQCTWYAYWRVQEGFNMSDPPCWYSGSGSSGYGAYTDAKYWLDHYRDPWEVKGTNYSPVPGDIIVFTGTFGHVVVVEAVNADNTLTITDYNLIAGNETWGRKTNYVFPNTIQGPVYSTGACIGVLHYPGSGPTPEQLSISITPSSYTKTMHDNESYVDFPFNIVISGIPSGQTVSGGNTYPGLTRIYNTGWSYTDYTVGGVTYRRAEKDQTLRYSRESSSAYTTTKYMYFNLSFSTGTINTTTPMNITVEAENPSISVAVLAALFRKLAINRAKKCTTIRF